MNEPDRKTTAILFLLFNFCFASGGDAERSCARDKEVI